jgi:acyl-CoA thioesterase YciA
MSENTVGNLTTRTVAMPADTNPAGDIFGGWVLSQMDIAAASVPDNSHKAGL